MKTGSAPFRLERDSPGTVAKDLGAVRGGADGPVRGIFNRYRAQQ